MSAGQEEPDGFDPVTWHAHRPAGYTDAETLEWEPPSQDMPPVDGPDEPRTLYGTAMRASTADRLPIIPAWMRNRRDARQVFTAAGKGVAYHAGYHLFWSWKYAFRLCYRWPVGAGRAVRAVWAWVFDREGRPVRSAAIRAEDSKEYRALEKARNDRVRLRVVLAVAGIVVVASGAGALRMMAPAWMQAVVAAGLVLVLAWHGSPAGKPITDRVTPGQRYIKLTAEMTRAAIIACKVGVKEPGEIAFTREIYRDPPGHTALVDLPAGVIALDIVDKREQLAGAMRLPKQQVWPSHARGDHPSRLRIWVADKPVNAMRAPQWPLLKSGEADYFKPFPFGTDEQLHRIDWMLAERNSLFAGIPGAGKSLAARVVALGAALDPLVDFVIYDLKGLGDLDPLEPLCLPGMYGSGPDEETKAGAMAALEWLYAECERRPPLVKAWVKRGLNSENKVNRAMAMRDARLRPIVAVFDEVQELITDPEYRKRAIALLTSIVKRSRAMGIHLILATQRLDKLSLPREITSNIAIRYCLAVPSHVETDLVLGTGAYSRGARPTEFQPGPPPEFDSGWGWRTGYGPMGVVRAAWISNDDAHAIVKRALAAREGMARREDPERVQARNILADVRAVLMPGEDALWSELIIERLVELDPDIYGGLTVKAFGALMAAAGLPTMSIHRKVGGIGKTRYGVKLPELEAAIAAKEVSQ